jgi:hypothetical protein
VLLQQRVRAGAGAAFGMMSSNINVAASWLLTRIAVRVSLAVAL